MAGGSYKSWLDEEEKARKQAESFYNCRICIDGANDPVVTFCGHVFCWPCIHKWLNISNKCPVCKTEVKAQNLTPINGFEGESSQEKPAEMSKSSDDQAPPKPQARRVVTQDKLLTSRGLRREPSPSPTNNDEAAMLEPADGADSEIESMVDAFLRTDSENDD